MTGGLTSRRQHKCKTHKSGTHKHGTHEFKATLLLLLAAGSLGADQRCVSCHPKEDAGYARTAMAHSLTPVKDTALPPDGEFEHEVSKTRFVIHSSASGMTQSLSRKDETAEQTAAFSIGSGAHAFGYLMQVGDHLFQSPLSYYTSKKVWDMAPGYEADRFPDFSRPVTAECLFCHAGQPLPLPDTLNRFQSRVFGAYGISCERCHGAVAAHLKSPAPGSIINPAKLVSAARASVCEQCHLIGETRISNPGKAITDFQPGRALEDYYTTYIAAQSAGQSIKVVSHAEQLALSKCARSSGDQLWCGTCHNPHAEPAQPAAYFRERCLTCHAAKLDKAHAAADRDCVGCHMPKVPARDGGHTAFTDHRIARNPAAETGAAKPDTISAWREPDGYVKERNLALGLVAVGLEHQSPPTVIRGYKMMNHLAATQFPNDPDLFTSLGLVLMKSKEAAEALKCFRKVLTLRPDYAPYYVNAAMALLATNQTAEAAIQLEKARALDPLLEQTTQLLHQIYHDQGQKEKSEAVLAEYDKAMGSSHH
jgi:tetratricopeptide (TPR) repeat protein